MVPKKGEEGLDKTTVIKRIIMTLLTVLVIMYVISVICRASFTQVNTIIAKETIAYNAVTCDCFVIHEETLVTANGGGIISYMVEDGEKVSVNEPIAGVFDSVASAGTKQESERLQKQIQQLTQLQANAETLTKTPSELDKEVGNALIRANIERHNGNLSAAALIADDILYTINERQLVTGKSLHYGSKISELELKNSQLTLEMSKGKKSKEIRSPSTGYFVSSADGYENAFAIDQLDKIMPENMAEGAIQKKEVADNVIGKTIGGVYWYVACPVTAEEALKIKNAYRLQLDVPMVSSDKLEVELYSVNQKHKSADAVVILRGTFMNAEMASLRKGKFSIMLRTYQGIAVPKTAVHEQTLTREVTDDKGNTTTESKVCAGVFIKFGNEVAFREILPIFSGEDYVISSLSPDDQQDVFLQNPGALQVYDEIIVEGANLYAGKIIGRNV